MTTRGDYTDLADDVSVERRDSVSGPPHGVLLAAVDKAVEVLGVTVLNAIVLLVFVNACGRYLFSKPVVWTEEIVAGLLIWLVMLGAYLALGRRQMIASNALIDRLPARVRVAAQIFSNVLAAVCLSFLAYVGWQYLDLFGTDRTPYFGMPKGWYLAALPIAAAAMALTAAFHATSLASSRRP